jgi:hypothetical protein
MLNGCSLYGSKYSDNVECRQINVGATEHIRMFVASPSYYMLVMSHNIISFKFHV